MRVFTTHVVDWEILLERSLLLYFKGSAMVDWRYLNGREPHHDSLIAMHHCNRRRSLHAAP
jgi:hypothetical protein